MTSLAEIIDRFDAVDAATMSEAERAEWIVELDRTIKAAETRMDALVAELTRRVVETAIEAALGPTGTPRQLSVDDARAISRIERLREWRPLT
jgi:hypothetical protein